MAKALRKSTALPIDFESIGMHAPDPDQAQVLENLGKSLVINAGAGSGKTGTLTHAIVETLFNYEMENGPIGPHNILAITYTKAAAAELKERVANMLAALGEEQLAAAMESAWISTIHSFCQRVLNNYAADASLILGRDLPLVNIDEVEESLLKEQALDEILEEFEARDPNIYQEFMSQKSEDQWKKSVKDVASSEAIYPQDKLIKHLESEEDFEARNLEKGYEFPAPFLWEKNTLKTVQLFSELIEKYQNRYGELKRKINKVDFSDLIQALRLLLKERDDIRLALQKQFAIIFIDEFQDTNHLQYEIFKEISDDNLIVVGDKRQSIYAFQGADVSVFDRALNQGSPSSAGALQLQLANNYRSNPKVLNLVNTLFSAPLLFGDSFAHLNAKAEDKSPTLLPKLKGYKVGSHNSSANEDAAEWFAEEFEALHQEEGIPYEDMCILVRARDKAGDYQQALKSRGIDSIVLGGREMYGDPYVSSLLDFASYCLNPLDDQNFVLAAISEYGQVEDEALALLKRLADAVRAHRETQSDARASSEPLFHVALAYLSYSEAEQFAAPASHLNQELVDLQSKLNISELSQGAHDSLKLFIMRSLEAQSLIGHISPSDIFRYLIGSAGVDLLLDGSEPLTQISFSPEHSLGDLLVFLNEVENREEAGQSFALIVNRLLKASEEGIQKENSELLVQPEISTESGRQGAVIINTIHGSKGLEYPVVALGLPHMKSSDKDAIRASFVEDSLDSSIRHRYFGMGRKLNDTEKAARALLEKELPYKGKNEKLRSSGGESASHDYRLIEEKAGKSEEEHEYDRLLYVALTRAKEQLLIAFPEYVKAKPEAAKAEDTLTVRLTQVIKDLESEGALDGLAEVEWVEKSEKSDAFVELESYRHGSPTRLREALQAERKAFATLELPKVKTPRWIEQLSASDINQFNDCPRQYWYRKVLRLGEKKEIELTQATDRGSAVHEVLELITDGSIHFDGELHYDDVKHILQRYIEDEKDAREAFEVSKLALHSESNSLSTMDQQHAELQFYLPFTDRSGHQCFLNGYIDAYGRSGDEVLILDYKTGYAGRREPEIFQTQAEAYALYALSQGAKKVKASFLFVDTLLKQVKGEACDDSTTVEFDYDESDYEALLEALLTRKEKLETTGLISLEAVKEQGYTPSCRHCSFSHGLCEGLLGNLET